VQPQRGGHILRMRPFPDLTHRPDPQRLKRLVIKFPAVVIPHGTILPDHKIKVRLLLNSLVTRTGDRTDTNVRCSWWGAKTGSCALTCSDWKEGICVTLALHANWPARHVPAPRSQRRVAVGEQRCDIAGQGRDPQFSAPTGSSNVAWIFASSCNNRT
jgi:hypothetical protein